MPKRDRMELMENSKFTATATATPGAADTLVLKPGNLILGDDGVDLPVVSFTGGRADTVLVKTRDGEHAWLPLEFVYHDAAARRRPLRNRGRLRVRRTCSPVAVAHRGIRQSRASHLGTWRTAQRGLRRARGDAARRCPGRSRAAAGRLVGGAARGIPGNGAGRRRGADPVRCRHPGELRRERRVSSRLSRRPRALGICATLAGSIFPSR